MRPEVSDLVLNAFVDGELPPVEAARIADVIAKEPAVARRVAHLHQMKAALSAMSDDLVLPEPPLPRHETQRRFWGAGALVAGCALLLAMLWSAPVSAPTAQDSKMSLMAQHDQWVSMGVERADFDFPVRFEWLGPLMHAGGLQLVYHSQSEETQHFGFKGANACRLSLFVSNTQAPASPLQLSLTERVQHAQWHIGTYAFEMIARDMAPARFATVATSLHRGSQDYAADEALQVALLQAARLSCTA